MRNNICKIDELEELKGAWLMMVDRAVNSKGTRVGTILISPNKQYTELRSIYLGFPLSNNQAEYKVLINGLLLAESASIQSLEGVYTKYKVRSVRDNPTLHLLESLSHL